MNDVIAARELLSAHDPLTHGGKALDDLTVERIWRQLLDDIDQGVVSRVRPPLRRETRLVRSAIAAIVVLACALGALAVTGRHASSTHYIALEPLNYSRGIDPAPAGQALNQLAAAARAQPAPIAGGWHYLEIATWSVFQGSDAHDLPPGMPGVAEIWTAADGAQRVVSHSNVPAPSQGLAAWLSAGLPVTGGQTESHVTTAEAAQFPAELSSDPAILRRQLLDADFGSSSLTPARATVELFAAIRDLRAARPIDPTLQSALLRMLAGEPGVVSLGTAIDRLGRVVDAFAVDSDYSGLPTRDILLFDPADGQLLGSERVLTTSAGDLGVQIPSVISYVIYVRDGQVHDDTTVPPPL